LRRSYLLTMPSPMVNSFLNDYCCYLALPLESELSVCKTAALVVQPFFFFVPTPPLSVLILFSLLPQDSICSADFLVDFYKHVSGNALRSVPPQLFFAVIGDLFSVCVDFLSIGPRGSLQYHLMIFPPPFFFLPPPFPPSDYGTLKESRFMCRTLHLLSLYADL